MNQGSLWPSDRSEAGSQPVRVNEAPGPEPDGDLRDTAHPQNWQERIHQTLHTIRSNPTGRIALKAGVGTLGLLTIAVGLVLIPLPGPGWAIVIIGLAILAIEFVWARHLLTFTRRHVRGWTRWAPRQSLPLRLLLGAVGLIFVVAVAWLSLKMSLNIDLITVLRDLLGKLGP